MYVIEKVTSYLALGSNIGNRGDNLYRGISLLSARPGIYFNRSSGVYESEPADYKNQPDFLNVVIEIETWLKPRELLETCLKIEEEMGRIKDIEKGPRNIDIDILLYNDATINEEGLIIPHPRLAERPFFLEPLKELAGDIRLPGFETRISGLLGSLGVYRLSLYKGD